MWVERSVQREQLISRSNLPLGAETTNSSLFSTLKAHPFAITLCASREGCLTPCCATRLESETLDIEWKKHAERYRNCVHPRRDCAGRCGYADRLGTRAEKHQVSTAAGLSAAVSILAGLC